MTTGWSHLVCRCSFIIVVVAVAAAAFNLEVVNTGLVVLDIPPSRWHSQGRSPSQPWPHSHSQKMVPPFVSRATLYSNEESLSFLSPTATSSPFGGPLMPIVNGRDNKDKPSSFLDAMGVPTYWCRVDDDSSNVDSENETLNQENAGTTTNIPHPRRMGLEAVVPGAYVVENAVSTAWCAAAVKELETTSLSSSSSSEELSNSESKFGQYNAGKNVHGALQVMAPNFLTEAWFQRWKFHGCLPRDDDDAKNNQAVGVNRRLRIYRYRPGTGETFGPHIDAGFPSSGLDFNETSTSTLTSPTLQWDDGTGRSSRYTVLLYLNDDFEGGHTVFYAPSVSTSSSPSSPNTNAKTVVASIRPRTGSILVFPQGTSESEVEYARLHWPTHEGSPVTAGSSRPKYVLRTDLLYKEVNNKEEEKRVGNDNNMNNRVEAESDTNDDVNEDPLHRYDHLVENAFANRGLVFDDDFLKTVRPTYRACMGVENVGPFLYSLLTFVKARRVLEVGAGYTTVWILQALRDNDRSTQRIQRLVKSGRCKLLDYPWTVDDYFLEFDENGEQKMNESRLWCVDDCAHQLQSATDAVGVAHSLGLAKYLRFIEGDAFDPASFKDILADLDNGTRTITDSDTETGTTTITHSTTTKKDEHHEEQNKLDVVWCDFGGGGRMSDFARVAWKLLKSNGSGLLLVHSAVTNLRTRQWLEHVRRNSPETVTGIPPGQAFEISLLEPHKRFQNAVTILQKRPPTSEGKGKPYGPEPIYSEYA